MAHKNMVFLNTNLVWGGGEKWTLTTAKAFQDRGYNVWIASRKDSSLLLKAKESGIKVKEVNLYNSLSSINPLKLYSFKKFLRDNKISILFLNLSRDLKFGVLASKLAGTEKVIYRRGIARPIKKRFYTDFILNRGITYLVANSLDTRKMIEAELNHIDLEEKLYVIYNGIEVQEIPTPSFSLYEKYGISEKDKILLNVGRLDRQKGHDLLLAGLKDLKSKTDNWIALVIGSGPEEVKIKRLIEEYGLREKVILTGFVHNLANYLVQGDILVHTARWEGFGFVLVEAMAMEVPVVAVAASNIPEIVIDGEVGLLAKPENPGDLADKLYTMITESEKRKKMARRARQHVQENFSLLRMIEGYSKLIHK